MQESSQYRDKSRDKNCQYRYKSYIWIWAQEELARVREDAIHLGPGGGDSEGRIEQNQVNLQWCHRQLV